MGKKKYKTVITKLGMLLYGAMVFVLFWGFAQATFEPDTLLGELTSSYGGRLIFAILLCVPFGVVDAILKRFGYVTSRREEIDGI